MRASLINRKIHRWGAIIIAAPILVIVVTGVILQLKKDVEWIQPPTRRGRGGAPTIGFDRVLQVVRTVPEAEVESWNDVDRLDVRPGHGMLKVRTRNRWEVQIDTATGEVLQVAERRSDLIESIHDGSWFHEKSKLALFLPSATVLLGLWVTGVYLFFLPTLSRHRRNKRRRAARRAHAEHAHSAP